LRPYPIRAKFHKVPAEMSGNSLAVKFLNSIRSEFDAQRKRYLDIPPDTWETMMNEHEKILELIVQRDTTRTKPGSDHSPDPSSIICCYNRHI
jgi:DNA-binding FadR family transcriptional regulator